MFIHSEFSELNLIIYYNAKKLKNKQQVSLASIMYLQEFHFICDEYNNNNIIRILSF